MAPFSSLAFVVTLRILWGEAQVFEQDCNREPLRQAEFLLLIFLRHPLRIFEYIVLLKGLPKEELERKERTDVRNQEDLARPVS